MSSFIHVSSTLYDLLSSVKDNERRFFFFYIYLFILFIQWKSMVTKTIWYQHSSKYFLIKIKKRLRNVSVFFFHTIEVISQTTSGKAFFGLLKLRSTCTRMTGRKKYIWRRLGTAHDPKHTTSSMKHGGAVWWHELHGFQWHWVTAV